MLKNYFKIAFRNLSKRKAYFFLNVFGLITGMTCCLLTLHYVSYERSYDSFQPLSKQIARVRLDIFQNEERQLQSAAVYPAIAPAMKKDFPEVEDFCRLHAANLVLSNDERKIKFTEQKGFYADPSFVKMFDVNLLEKKSADLLTSPFQIMLSETMAKKYFGRETAIGKQLIVRNPSFLQTYSVTGVFKDYPKNSHLSFDYLLSYSTYGKVLQWYGYPVGFTETSWEFRDFYAYIQLTPGTALQHLQAKLPAFCNRYVNDSEAYRKGNKRDELHLTPLNDIHLYSNYFYEAGANGNGKAVSFLFLIGLFIICIAWINYINLATARSVERAKEVGVRKLLGAVRIDLIKLFLAEGFLLNIVALSFSIFVCFIFLNRFDIFAGRDVAVHQLLPFSYWKLFIILFFTGTFLSSVYPAFVLSAFKPGTVLKGLFKYSPKGTLLRKGLITSQFIISIGLITATIIVQQQMQYMTKNKLGADIERTLVLQGSPSMNDTVYRNTYQSFKDELLRRTDIKNVAASTSVMGKEIAWTRNVQRLDISNAPAIPINHLGIDYDFIAGYAIPIAAGRNFSKQFGTEDKTVLLNEKAVQLLGFKNAAQAINKKIKRSADTVVIAGVVANFHNQGLQKEIEPIIFLLMPDTRNFYSLKIQSHNLQKTVLELEEQWKKYFRDDPFNYFFLDEAFNRQYRDDYLFQKVFSAFAFIAILIACTGLLGLSAYNVLQRAREVSIRKVLGAGVADVSILLTKDFVWLVVIAFFISTPVTWLLMNKWLQNFAFRIDIQWWVFLVGGFTGGFIALATIAFQVIKAAVNNPLKSLRTE